MSHHFHKILKRRLNGKNLSKIARELEIPRSVLQDWIHEKRSPSLKNIDYIKKLANHLNLTLDEILTGNQKEDVVSTYSFVLGKEKFKITICREESNCDSPKLSIEQS